MISAIANFSILGLPLVIYLGHLTFLSFAFTAILGLFFYIGKPLLPFRWHPRMAFISFFLGFIFGFLALGSYFNY